MIPKKIWQTYELEYSELSSEYLKLIDTWKQNNPEWEYNYVSANNRRNFIKENFDKEWLYIYDSYKSNILRSDLWRYMCLYKNGGVYADLDMLCKKPILFWLDIDLNFVVSEEPDAPGYTQSIFASSADNIFLKNILVDIKKQYLQHKTYSDIINYEINETGYIIFTNSINKTKESTQSGFMEFTKENSHKIHHESIKHFYAGNGTFFDKNYQSWKREKYEI